MSNMITGLEGKTFNNLTVIKRNGKDKYGHLLWLCVCKCGNVVSKDGASIQNGNVKSCGCLNINRKPRKHGLSKSKIYDIWWNMVARCTIPTNKAYKNYGGRGIQLDNKWLHFDGFYEDMGATYKEGLSLERTNVNGNYELSNCKWIPLPEQARNKRSNVLITINGITDIMINQCARYGISESAASARIRKLHWEPERAITTPVRKYK